VTQLATRTLSEYESKELLASVGVPVLDERLARDAHEAVAAAREIGAPGEPVVLKLCGAGVAHKTERGLVRLGVRGDDDVRRASESLLAAATSDDAAVGVLVAPMARGSRELIAGLHRDSQFGPSVMVGIGGVLAEAVSDVTFRLAPVEPVDADEMLDDLSTQAFLASFRGEPPLDRAALVEVVLGLSRLADTHTEIVSVDVNPLVVVDGRPVAVDALVEVEAR
jgi:acetyl-CoA synthetase (ADP-forming)